MPSGVGMNITTAISPMMIASAQSPAVTAMKMSANTNSATTTSVME